VGELLGTVLPLAAGAAISPAVLTVQLLTLSRKVAPLARGWATAAGYVLVLAGETVVALLLAAGTGGSDTPDETTAAIKLAAAVLLLAVGVRALRAPPKPDKAEPDSVEPRVGRYMLIGAALMITNITTTLLFVPAIHDVGVSDVDTAEKALAIALVLAITAIAAVVPPLAVTLLGHRADAPLAALNGFTTRHRRAINAGICFLFAAFLAAVSLPVLL
jgi:Sap, sulfolipid-1-addressing protein